MLKWYHKVANLPLGLEDIQASYAELNTHAEYVVLLFCQQLLQKAWRSKFSGDHWSTVWPRYRNMIDAAQEGEAQNAI